MSFDYTQAFSRNIGILSQKEQEHLRGARVAIAGAGGMGGTYAEALARMGVGSFVIADGDTFEVANFNRQRGATTQTVGINKARALEKLILSINPKADIRIWEEHLDANNIEDFLMGANLVMNAIEAFEVSSHRLLFSTARKHDLPVIFGAPLGFSGAVLVFDPSGMSADEYFDWHDNQDPFAALANFLIGMAPKALHFGQLDVKDINVEEKTGPSIISACLGAGAIATTEACRLLLQRGKACFVPAYQQFDPYTRRFRHGRLRWGCKGPWQRIKQRLVIRYYQKTHAGQQFETEAGREQQRRATVTT